MVKKDTTNKLINKKTQYLTGGAGLIALSLALIEGGATYAGLGVLLCITALIIRGKMDYGA